MSTAPTLETPAAMPGAEPGVEPAAGVRRGGAVAGVHAALDVLTGDLDDLGRIAQVAPGSLLVTDLGQIVAELQRLANRASALRDKGLAVAVVARAPHRSGARDTGQWFSRVAQVDPRVAHGDARRAEALALQAPTPEAPEPPEPAEPAEPDLGTSGSGSATGDAGRDDRPGLRLVGDPDETHDQTGDPPGESPVGPTATGRALLEGVISAAHADVIVTTLTDLPEDVAESVRAGCEVELLALAVGRTPRDLRRLAARILERVTGDVEAADVHEDDLAAAAEEAAWQAASFWMRDRDDGTCYGQFTVPTLAGHALKKILEAMSAPRRTPSPRPTSTIDDGSPRHPQPEQPARRDGAAWRGMDARARSLARMQRMGQELTTLLLHLPTDHLHDKTAATVMVTTRLEDLRDQLRRVGTTDTGHHPSAGEVRRAACSAGIIPTVLGSDSLPLDLGVQTRCYTPHQRAALMWRYPTCAADGCDVPFAWTETHHLTAWHAGGPTDLDNAAPLCGHHHRLIDQAAEHTITHQPLDPPVRPPGPTGPARPAGPAGRAGRAQPPVTRVVIRFRR